MKKILTIIFDGFGLRDETVGNAISGANMVNFNNLWKEYPHSSLEASGHYVGLNDGQFGNSEVGHMTIGAGRLVKQNEMIVNDFLEEGYKENEVFDELLQDKDKTFHIMGLCSDGGVHASVEHFTKLFDLLVENGIKNICFHLITDGRDTDTKVACKYIEALETKIIEHKTGEITSICGRYYAMDRDNNWDRTKIYYDLIINGTGTGALDAKRTIQNLYKQDITDEFLKPIIVNINSKIKNGDNIIWMNYRSDRAKQILNALTNLKFDKFNTKDMSDTKVYSFLPVDKKLKVINFTEASVIKNPLGLYFSELGISQERIAESEKYPHVTYFFDGGYDGKIEKCNKIEVPSPDVATYDLQPQMNAIGVTKKVVNAMENDTDFILVNFANPDMVGHTGNYEATVKACMSLDICLGKILEKADDNFYKVILLADHGNADIMYDEEGNVCTTHTTNKVPFVIMDKSVTLKEEGDLTMVAPTILEYMDIKIPSEMEETETLFK